MHIEQLINALKVLHRERHAFVPNIHVYLVAGLQFHEFLAAGFANVRIATGPFVCFLVNAHNFCERIALERLSIQQVLPAVNDHPELCAPVADVIIADNFVSKKLSHAGQGVTEQRAADMPDMHRFGHIRRAEINYDALWRICFGDTEPFISQHVKRLFSDRSRA